MHSASAKWVPGSDILLSIEAAEGLWTFRLLDGETQQVLAEATAPPAERDDASASADLLRKLLPDPLVREIQRQLLSGVVRLYVRAHDPSVQALPWEAMSQVLSGPLQIIRLIPATTPVEPIVESNGPIRALIAWANPDSDRYPALDSLEREAKSVAWQLFRPEYRAIRVVELPNASPATLSRAIADYRPHIVHILCHADIGATGGYLVLESGRPRHHMAFYADELASLLANAGVRLAVLSGCFTAEPLSGIAPILVAQGVRAVVGMQAQVPDASAHMFARSLYAALAEGECVAEAVHQSRLCLRDLGADGCVPALLVSTYRDACDRLLPMLGRTPTRAQHNLPFDDRPFIGRTREARELRGIIQDRQKRLITITGMGGMGKTRLAAHVALELLPSFPDGVWQVECDSLVTEEELRSAVASTLPLDDRLPTWQDIGAALASKHLLVVLDCFERLVAFAPCIERLLRLAPKVHVLVTSRSRLGLDLEHEYVLGPMSLKRKARGIPEGLDLFLKSAVHSRSSFKLEPANRHLLLSLVNALEGVPLAIVLAAGRLKHLSLEDLHTRVQTQRLDTLKRFPTSDGRHADMAKVIADSFDLISPAEANLAAKLSVFSGGFYVEDAIAVLGVGDDVLDGIARLLDNSLLIGQTLNKRMRFRTLDTIREYIERVTLASELDQVRMRHATYYAEKATSLRQTWDGGKAEEARTDLTLESANYRGAISHAMSYRLGKQLLCLGGALARLYLESGALSDAELLIEHTLPVAEQEENVDLLLELCGLLGAVYRRRADYKRASEAWLRRAALAERGGLVDTQADSLMDTADYALEQGDFETLNGLFAAFQRIEPQMTNVPLRAGCLVLQAKACVAQNDQARAAEYASQAESLIRNADDVQQTLYVLLNLAQVHRSCGNLEKSEALCKDMIGGAMSCGYPHYAGRGLLTLGEILETNQRVDDAAMALSVAARIPRSASPAVRDAVTRACKGFQERHGSTWFEPIEKSFGTADWTELVVQILAA